MSVAKTTTSSVEKSNQDLGSALVFESGQWALAIDLGLVERIVSSEEIRKVKVDNHPKIAAGFRGIVRNGKNHYLQWDIGEILGHKPERGSIVLLHVRTASGDTLPIALCVGKCLAVGPLPRRGLSALPTKLTQSRQGSFDVAFDHTRVQGVTRKTQGGLRVNLEHLWSAREIQQMQGVLRNDALVGAGS